MRLALVLVATCIQLALIQQTTADSGASAISTVNDLLTNTKTVEYCPYPYCPRGMNYCHGTCVRKGPKPGCDGACKSKTSDIIGTLLNQLSGCSWECPIKLPVEALKCAAEHDPEVDPIGFVTCLINAAKSSGCVACVCDFICDKYPSACSVCRSSSLTIGTQLTQLSGCSWECPFKLAAESVKCAEEHDPETDPIGFAECLIDAAKSSGCVACVCDYICEHYPSACSACRSSDNSLLIKNEDCCPLKSVGGTVYKFVEHITEEERKRLKCSNSCAYKPKHADKESNTKFCFKPGKIESFCGEEELPGNYNITNGFTNANTKCNGTYGENQPTINPSETLNIQISATVTCAAVLENKDDPCIGNIGTIQDLIIKPEGGGCVVEKKPSSEPTGSYTITNGFTNTQANCKATYDKSFVNIIASSFSKVQIGATVSCSVTINGVNVSCIKYMGPAQDLIVSPQGQGCIVQKKK